MNVYYTGIAGLVATEKSIARSVSKMRNESVAVLCKHLGAVSDVERSYKVKAYEALLSRSLIEKGICQAWRG